MEGFLIAAVVIYKPYKDHQDDYLDMFGHAIIIIWLALSLVLRQQDDAGVSDEEQIVLEVCYFALLFAIPLLFVGLWLKQAFCPEEQSTEKSHVQAAVEEVPNPISVPGEHEQQYTGDDLSNSVAVCRF